MKRATLCLAAMLSLGLGSPASAYSELLVFGDSLVDSGNARIGAIAMGLPDPAPPELGYFQGRFSNGYNFADYLSLGYWGAPATAYLQAASISASAGRRRPMTLPRSRPASCPSSACSSRPCSP